MLLKLLTHNLLVNEDTLKEKTNIEDLSLIYIQNFVALLYYVFLYTLFHLLK